MKVTNRSDSIVTYTLQEYNLRRVFAIGETKELEEKELNALFQLDGGANLIKDNLLIEDEKWVAAHWDAPLEYFWSQEEVIKCLKEDSLELFSETLDFAPQGVIDLIKLYSWKLPLTDLNKINLIQEKLNFDVQMAVKVMADGAVRQVLNPKTRLRKKEE